ncbi:MAG TPA: nuclear transport factor 2 family protein [Frankiaceae bacterium]|nr:nuclear transport factor 2 family protein [Frankiaceae bacterium]
MSDREADVATARAHAEAEGTGDMEGTMNTLGPDPVYEFLPIGRLLKGRENAQAYYEHFFANFARRIAGYTLRAEWVTDEGLGQEYQVFIDEPGGAGRRRFDIVGILLFGPDGLLSGERIYASDELLAMMVGPILERTEPVPVG